MTFVGKVLIVVNVMLTICVAAFAGGVFAFQDSWQKKYVQAQGDLDAQKKRRDKEAKDLEDKLDVAIKGNGIKGDDFEIGRTDYKNSSVKFQTAVGIRPDPTKPNDPGSGHLGAIAGYEADLRLIKAAQALALRERQLLALDNLIKQKQVTQLRTFLKENQVKTDALRAEKSRLEDVVHGLQIERVQMERKFMAMLQREIKYKHLLAINDVTYNLLDVFVSEPPPIPAPGIVLDTLTSSRSRETLVLLSVGRDDDVIVGQMLFVYRLQGKGTYLGKIEVTHVYADTAVAKLVVKTKNGTVQKGDHVSAKLK